MSSVAMAMAGLKLRFLIPKIAYFLQLILRLNLLVNLNKSKTLGFNISINGQVATPGSLNKWLVNNNGYHCIDNICWNLALDAPDRIAPNRIRSLGEPLV